MTASLHQLRCFLATLEAGSLTGAATEMDLAQPSVSEQVRLLERSVGASLFRRVGRGMVPTEAAEALRPHAERAVNAADAGHRAVRSVASVATGTIRFGIFGTARLYLGAQLVADVLERHPGVRVELIGQNSTAVQEDLRRGRLEAAMIAIPVAAEGMVVRPVARDELVYVSSDPERLAKPVTPAALASAQLVLPETTWRDDDSSRRMLREVVQRSGATLQTRIEVEDVETAVEIVGLGLADSVLPRGVVDPLLGRLAPNAGWVSLRPRMYDSIAMVHRRDADLSPAARSVIELATRRIQSITEPL
ncbi:MAG TPA: LysR family transcriptional regulator [Nocardioidaceae bacterium]|nr:LysR family transcriptional regulator [Nocardioidaceae bacterium]